MNLAVDWPAFNVLGPAAYTTIVLDLAWSILAATPPKLASRCNASSLQETPLSCYLCRGYTLQKVLHARISSLNLW